MTPRVALVTGSSRGIGRAIALRLARDGAAVAVNYRERREQAQEVVEAITRGGGRAVAIRADLASAADCARLVDTARQALGPIDILVNNAGVFRKGDLADFDFSQMDGMRNVNVDGLARVTRGVIADMQRHRPAGACVTARNLTEPQRAVFHYFAGITAAGKSDCALLLVHTPSAEAPAPGEGWKLAWRGTRPGDNKEFFWLFSR